MIDKIALAVIRSKPYKDRLEEAATRYWALASELLVDRTVVAAAFDIKETDLDARITELAMAEFEILTRTIKASGL